MTAYEYTEQLKADIRNWLDALDATEAIARNAYLAVYEAFRDWWIARFEEESWDEVDFYSLRLAIS